MEVKEKIVRQAIKEVESEIKKIDSILFANPLSDIIKLREETIEKAKKMKAGSKEVLKYLDIQCKKEKALFGLAKKQCNAGEKLNRKAKLSLELIDLKNELFLLMG